MERASGQEKDKRLSTPCAWRESEVAWWRVAFEDDGCRIDVGGWRVEVRRRWKREGKLGMMVEYRMMDVRGEMQCQRDGYETTIVILLRSRVRTYIVQWAMGQHKLELTVNQNSWAHAAIWSPWRQWILVECWSYPLLAPGWRNRVQQLAQGWEEEETGRRLKRLIARAIRSHEAP